ncbi:MAG: aminodeoxychorismate synthase component I, partial [Proteobacteria bacterium]
MLNWVNRFNICCFLDNHRYHLSHSSIECVVAAGSLREMHTLQDLQNNDDWLFGHLSYDLKNQIEALTSSHRDGIGFPDLFFFVPEYVLQLNNTSLSIGSVQDDHQEIFSAISSFSPPQYEKNTVVS